ncbi:hypothetical protein I4U23_004995 [Adineta vaga]|nr:hypothetical protein I4U23_004995 [Adineta vaga]
MVKTNQKKFNKISKEKLDPASLQATSQNPPHYSKTVYQNNLNIIPSTPSKSFCSKCSVSRCVCIQLLIFLGLLVLAAIIIPILVIILDTQASPCARTYSQSFTTGITQAAQCTAWQQFTTGLTCISYSKMRIYGSNDATGITVSDPNVVTALAVALRYNTTLALTHNGISWRVWQCSSGYEITSSGSACSCTVGYTIRPCPWVNGWWGGVQTTSCSAASQTLSLYFE